MAELSPVQEHARRAALIMMLLGQGQPQPPPAVPNLLGAREPNERPERPQPGGGDIGALLSVLGGPAAPASIFGSLVASDAMGRRPDPSLLTAPGLVRLVRGSGDQPDRGQVSRSDRIRSPSNREAGGGFTA